FARIRTYVLQSAIRRGGPPHETIAPRRLSVTEVRRILVHGNDHPDRWLMQSVIEASSSEQAREAAAVWLASYDAALGLGAAVQQAHVVADTAYRASAARTGLAVGEGRQS
ncbi:MAG TPA: hypothetical protein VGK33_16515, partial [Chloroflexota bacterium]